MKEPKPQLIEIGNGAFWQLYRALKYERPHRSSAIHAAMARSGTIADNALPRSFDLINPSAGTTARRANQIVKNTRTFEPRRTSR
jgi:hypothetical protein